MIFKLRIKFTTINNTENPITVRVLYSTSALYKSEISLPDGKMKKQSENKFWVEINKAILTYQKSFSENNFWVYF